jgi:nucleotide-binding universal stress UspA family protein
MTENKNNSIKQPTIIACVDISNASNMALQYACQKAKKLDFILKILIVMEASHKNLMFGSRIIAQDKRKNFEEKSKKLVAEIEKKIKITPIISLREGDIMNEIIQEVKNTADCAMLVLGKSQNTMSDNSLLPKIVQKISNKIKVPVTIVPENLSADFLQKLI